MLKEARNDDSNKRKLIPLGMMISDTIVENKLVARLEEMQFHDDLYTDVGKSFNGRNLKNMLMIKDVDPLEALWPYMMNCLDNGSNPGVDVCNLPNVSPDAFHKWKRKSKNDDTEDAEVQKRIATEASRAAKAVKPVQVAKVVEFENYFEASKASKARVAAEVAMIAEESSFQIKESEQESAKVSAHQNLCKFSNSKISNIYESIIVDTSFVPVLITTINDL
ncbi:hypothetical protein KIW84_065459 [Lathyrus oleraceus]|uniref:Uncharacterized protein n=1 Tax=Pisum sativum TaxID=3888 RepID=A0A9D5ACI0_PEA|nr:hypothetical protein KIW84_065459 [Pisum sativum]